MSEGFSEEPPVGHFVRLLRASLAKQGQICSAQIREQLAPLASGTLGHSLLRPTTLLSQGPEAGREADGPLPGNDCTAVLEASLSFLEQLVTPDNFGAAFRHAAIDAVLRKYEGDALARSDRAQGSLEPSLRERLVSLAEQILLLAPSQPSFESDRLELDEGFARCLDTVGEGGRKIGAKVRQASAERAQAYRQGLSTPQKLFRLWLPPEGQMAPRFASALAEALWLDEVRPRLEREKHKPAALVMAVHEPVVHLLSRTQRPEVDGPRSIRLEGDVLVKVSAVDADTLNAIFVDRGIELFGSITAHRLLRWEILTAHRQALSGHPDPRVLTVDGGYLALAHDVLGMKAKIAKEQVHAIIEAQHACEIPLPPNGDYSRLLIRRFLAAAGQRRARLELVLGTALLPNYVHELRAAMGHGLEARRALRLVPVLDLPPFIGRQNEHGQQATLSMLVVAYLRDHARELVDTGGVRLDEAALGELARRAAVPSRTLPELLMRWTRDDDDGPAFLKRLDPDRYTLSDAHHNERTFIEEGARRECEGSHAGQKSASRRRAKLKRLGVDRK